VTFSIDKGPPGCPPASGWASEFDLDRDVLSMSREDVQALVGELGEVEAFARIAAAARKQLRSIRLVAEVGAYGARARELRHEREVESYEDERRRLAHGRALAVHERLQREQLERHGGVVARDQYGDPVVLYVKSKVDVRDASGRKVAVYVPQKLAPGVMVVAEDEPATAPSEQENVTTKPPAKRKRRSKKP
jgi:hypothetical protein